MRGTPSPEPHCLRYRASPAPSWPKSMKPSWATMAPLRASRSGPIVTLSIFELWATMRSRLGFGLWCRSISPWIIGPLLLLLARLDDDPALALEGELHGLAGAPADEGLEPR